MPKKVLIALPPAMLEQVDFIAQCEHRTRSDLVREALRRYLDAFRRQQTGVMPISMRETVSFQEIRKVDPPIPQVVIEEDLDEEEIEEQLRPQPMPERTPIIGLQGNEILGDMRLVRLEPGA